MLKHTISLLILMSFVFLISSSSVFASKRTSANSAYIWGYGGILSAGYQRLIHDRVGINVSAGSIMLLHEDLRDGFTFPVNISFYSKAQKHRFYADLGFAYITKGKSNPLYDFKDGVNTPYIIGFGYNYHPPEGGSFYKLGPAALLYEPKSDMGTLKLGLIWSLAIGKAF